MPTIARSSFVIDKKTPSPVTFPGGQMSHTRFEKTFTGDVVGTSVVEALLAGLDHDGPAIYVGIERFDCRVGGRTGTFVLMHAATQHAGGGSASWTIVPGSGTGELAGITGKGEILPNHDFVMTYDVEGA
jgi:hypothetical protein